MAVRLRNIATSRYREWPTRALGMSAVNGGHAGYVGTREIQCTSCAAGMCTTPGDEMEWNDAAGMGTAVRMATAEGGAGSPCSGRPAVLVVTSINPPVTGATQGAWLLSNTSVSMRMVRWYTKTALLDFSL
jgi:hypothetical protein